MKKMKRFVATGCAAALAMSAAAGAADPASTVLEGSDSLNSPTTFTYAGELSSGTIKITMGSEGKVYLNPYGIEVPVTSAVNSTDGVISPTQFIKNESSVALDVAITPTITKAGKVVLTTDEIWAAGTDADGNDVTKGKYATVDFQITSATDDSTEPTGWDSGATVDAVAKSKTLTQTGWTIGKPADASTPSYAAFRLKGHAVASPKIANGEDDQGNTIWKDDLWTSADSVSGTIAFTFIPSAKDEGYVDPSSGTGTTPGGGGGTPAPSETVVATFTKALAPASWGGTADLMIAQVKSQMTTTTTPTDTNWVVDTSSLSITDASGCIDQSGTTLDATKLSVKSEGSAGNTGSATITFKLKNDAGEVCTVTANVTVS